MRRRAPGARGARVVRPSRWRTISAVMGAMRHPRPRPGGARRCRLHRVSPMKTGARATRCRPSDVGAPPRSMPRCRCPIGARSARTGRTMRITRHRAGCAAHREPDPTSRAARDPRIANHHLLRIAMHFGASYIREADRTRLHRLNHARSVKHRARYLSPRLSHCMIIRAGNAARCRSLAATAGAAPPDVRARQSRRSSEMVGAPAPTRTGWFSPHRATAARAVGGWGPIS